MEKRGGLSLGTDTRWPLAMTVTKRSSQARPFVFVLMLAVMVSAGCDGNTPTSPSTTTDTSTTTATTPVTITEEFTGRLGVGGYSFFSFTTAQTGTIALTLTSVGGQSVPSTVWLGLGIGVPNAEDCVTSTSVNTAAGSSAQISGSYNAGVYCARLHDIGNLLAPASFNVTIARPE